MTDTYGNALSDYFNGCYKPPLLLHNNYDVPEEMPVKVFFRGADEMPELEKTALKSCEGSILDIGAGVGSHSLLLRQNFAVTSLEINKTACNIMQKRDVKHIINEDIFQHQRKYDTLLLLMNGIGLCQKIKHVPAFLNHAKTLLNPGGQIIFDSSDIAYLYDEVPFKGDDYYGEIIYQYEYKKQLGEKFGWLYVDAPLMQKLAFDCGFNAKILFDDGDDQYLMRLKLQNQGF